MRPLIIALLLLTAACTTDKYSEIPKIDGPWSPANADPASTDNNIVPLEDLQMMTDNR
jgi:hypothetical protein